MTKKDVLRIIVMPSVDISKQAGRLNMDMAFEMEEPCLTFFGEIRRRESNFGNDSCQLSSP